MKHYFISLLLLALNVAILPAQSTEKIKGNRMVSIIETEIGAFHTIALDEDFEVDLIYNESPSVEIETDENLHEIIDFSVKDSVLRFNKLKRIISKKELRIKISYNASLRNIKVTENAELNGLIPLRLTNTSLKTSGSAKVGLTIETETFNFESTEKAKVKLNVTADSCNISMAGSGKLEALINTPTLDAALYERADAIIEGNCDTATIELDNNAQFQGKNFTLNTCDVICNIASDAYVEVIKQITLTTTGTSAVYLYDNPKILIQEMTDTSKLQKKVK